MRSALPLLALCLVVALPAVAAAPPDSPIACESSPGSGICMDYCLYGMGISYGVAVLHGGDVARVWFPDCPVM